MARIRSGYPPEHNEPLTIRSPWLADVATDSSNIWKPSCHSGSQLSSGGKSAKYNRNVQAGARIRSGQGVSSYLNDYYYRVHVTPRNIDVGNMLTDITREVEVWNAWPEGNLLSGIQGVNTGGMELIGPEQTPTEYKPLEARVYELKVSNRGAPVIDAQFNMHFRTETPQLTVVGRRVLIWPFMPQTVHKETLEWMTDIIPSYNSEQRIAIRTAPRQAFDYVFQLDPHQFSRAKAIATQWAHRTYGIPVWSELVRVGEVGVGATEILMDTRFIDLRVGSMVIIWETDDHNIAAEVTEVLVDRIKLRQPMEVYFNVAYVAPMRFALTRNGMQFKRGARDTTISTSQFQVSDNIELVDDQVYPMYRGTMVLSNPSVLLEDLNERIYRSVDVFDNGSGPVVLESKNNWVNSAQGITIDVDNREELWKARKWLHQLRGKQKSFWVPTWNRDMELLEDVPQLGTFLVVQNIGYSNYYGIKDIMIRLVDGTLLFMRANHASEDPQGNDKLQLDAPLPDGIIASQVDLICFMSHVRLNTDRVELGHNFAGRVTSMLPILETPE